MRQSVIHARPPLRNSPRRNKPCQILFRSVKGFLGGSTTKLAISYAFSNDPYNSTALLCRQSSIDLCWILTWFAVCAGELWWTIARVRIAWKIFIARSSVLTLVVVVRVTQQLCSTSPWPQSITNALCSHHCSDKYQMPISEYKYSDLHCRNADSR